MTEYILSLVRDSFFFFFLNRAFFHFYNLTEIGHLTSYPQTSSSNNQEFIAIRILCFFLMVSMAMGRYNVF